MEVLKASIREMMGTRPARRLRNEGKVPAVVYGHGEVPMHVVLNEHDVELAIQHGERLLQLDVSGQAHNVLVKELQYDTFGHTVLHIDMARVNLDERVTVTVPIVLRGTPAGAAEGGTLQQVVAEVEVECVVTAIPEEIRVPVAAMKVGDSLHMRDLPLPEGASLRSDPELLVVHVSVLAEEEVAAAAAVEGSTTEPEVIGRKKEEEGEGEEAAPKAEKPEKGEK